MNIPDWQLIKETHHLIAPFINRTPVLTCESLNYISGTRLFFKCENFQKVGAFKMRGAASAALRLNSRQRDAGLATHSSGNHAQAVARAAKLLGLPAYVVMPNNAPLIKQKATEEYGAKIIFCEASLASREKTLDKVVSDTGSTFIHPFDNSYVIAGQATAAKELIEDEGPFDLIMAPIGGGGLMSGTAICSRHLLPDCQLIGAEPEKVDDAYRSFKSGQLKSNASTDTIADGLKTNLSELTFSIIKQHLDDIITVSEHQIIYAMRLIWERMKIIVEPSCAVPFAAILAEKERFNRKKVGIILSGGNVDLSNLPF